MMKMFIYFSYRSTSQGDVFYGRILRRNVSLVYRPHRLHAVHEMRPVVTDVARSVVCVSVCVGHTGELCKTAEPIEMQFGRQTG